RDGATNKACAIINNLCWAYRQNVSLGLSEWLLLCGKANHCDLTFCIETIYIVDDGDLGTCRLWQAGCTVGAAAL
ncbi:MAG: hypothetical protein KDE47_01945, partial [Caldilineaceae bacterium]|nr:hypothetical protein [Caldilineaceae bacterium]